jgi:hypothetical protein
MSFLRFILATNNFLSWLAVVVVLALSFSGVLNNVTLIGIAHEFPTTFTPDGLAFFFLGVDICSHGNLFFVSAPSS